MSAAQVTLSKRDRRNRTPASDDAPPQPGCVEPPSIALEARESELVLAWFRLLARCRGAWLQRVWTDEGSNAGHVALTQAELACILSDEDSPQAETAWSANQEAVLSWRTQAEEVHDRLSTLPNSRIGRLARVFGLSRQEVDLLQVCAAVAFDPSLAHVCAYLQDYSGRAYVTQELAARLLQLGRSSVWAPEMNIFRWELIHRQHGRAGEPTALICDPQIKDWLLGRNTLDEILVDAVKLIEPHTRASPEWPVDEIAAWVDASLQQQYPPKLRVIVIAPRGGGKRTFAGAVAQKLDMPLIIVNADTSDESNWTRLFVHAQRQGFLDTAALAWTGEVLLRRTWPASHAFFPIQFVLCEPGSEPAPVADAIDRKVRLPIPEAATREQLWRQFATQAKQWPDHEVRKLAARHSVWPGDIEHASRLGPSTPADAAYLVREAGRSRFGNLAQILECPFAPNDLVLPQGVQQLLDAIAFEAEERGSFWRQDARRLFPQGRGLIALFSGPSGTGKTMAAQVIAARLTRDLCRVNIAQLVSKWVGETPKNIEHVIRLAAENETILFFDEADALFARRAVEVRDAQDKFANTDAAFLLQALESFPGIAILATNLKCNIDPAFLRRLRYLVEFPKPDAALQRILWTKLVTSVAGEDRARALEPVFELLSTATEATGAQIKFAVLGGWFAARADGRALNTQHLLVGLDRELAKEGRAIGPRERDRIVNLKEIE